MARQSPQGKIARLHKATVAWQKIRPASSYGGLTLAQFKRTIQPSHDKRAEINDLRSRLRVAIAERNQADLHSMRTLQRIVYAVQGDPNEGPDGALYAALGYVRRSARKRRRKK